jgi:polysaccharide pyruvyl transferase WcaK-like protein
MLVALRAAASFSQVGFSDLAQSRLTAALEQVSSGKVVITNRLHGSILANLIGRPVIWIDTKGKKVSGKLCRVVASASFVCSISICMICITWMTGASLIWSIGSSG